MLRSPTPQAFKFALRSGAKGSSLGADSGAYAASAFKGAPKVLSREARAKALSSANHLCIVREAIKVPREPKIASTKTM